MEKNMMIVNGEKNQVTALIIDGVVTLYIVYGRKVEVLENSNVIELFFDKKEIEIPRYTKTAYAKTQEEYENAVHFLKENLENQNSKTR